VNLKGEREAKRKKGQEEEERTNILPRDTTQKCKCTHTGSCKRMQQGFIKGGSK